MSDFGENYSGLRSGENSCFLNVGIQVLKKLPELRAQIDARAEELLAIAGNSFLCTKLSFLFTEMDAGNVGSASPTARAVRDELFAQTGRLGGKTQEDFTEAFEALLGCLKLEGLDLTPIFKSVSETSVICGNQMSCSLSLPDSDSGNVLFALLCQFGTVESSNELIFDNGNHICEGCGSKAIKTRSFSEVSSILVVNFPRNIPNRPRIRTPVILSNEITINEVRYSIAATVVFSGEHNRGHYFVDLKTDGGWFRISDQSVTKISDREAATNQSHTAFYTRVESAVPKQLALIIEDFGKMDIAKELCAIDTDELTSHELAITGNRHLRKEFRSGKMPWMGKVVVDAAKKEAKGRVVVRDFPNEPSAFESLIGEIRDSDVTLCLAIFIINRDTPDTVDENVVQSLSEVGCETMLCLEDESARVEDVLRAFLNGNDSKKTEVNVFIKRPRPHDSDESDEDEPPNPFKKLKM